MNQLKIKELVKCANDIRKLTIQCIGKLGVGHIGGCLSICDALAVLYFHSMNIDPERPLMEERDRFVLSKGHGGPALYAALALRGFIPVQELDTLNRPNTNPPSHCDRQKTNGIDMTTGSLGQGFSAATGMAMAAKMDNRNLHIYAMIGDGESQEGQIWEAAMFAGSHKLHTLVAFTDYNRMQIDGTNDEVNSLAPLDKKWDAFGFYVQSVGGHDVAAIAEAIDNAKKQNEKPSMIILNTIKGKGAYFCEGQVTSHNMPITEEMWKKAVALLDEGGEEQ